MDDILKRLEHQPCYCEQSDARQLRRDAAEYIREQQRELDALRLALKLKATHDHC